MVRNDALFYLSGVISLFLFGSVIVLFAYVMVINDTIKTFAFQKDNYISVSLNLVPVKTPSKTPSKETKPKSKKNTPMTSAKSDTISKPKDIKSLFSDVQTHKIVHQKRSSAKTIDTKHIKQIQKRIKTKDIKRSFELSQKVASMNLASISEAQTPSTSSALEVNQYLAKIQATVYEYFYPPLHSEGSRAKIRLWLSASGIFEDFRVLAYSGNSDFNHEVDALKARLQQASFAANPDGRSISIDIILMTKE